MKLEISKEYDFEKKFIYKYLPKYIHNLVIDSIETSKIILIDKEFHIDSKKIISRASSNLVVVEDSVCYTIGIDKNLKIDGISADLLINMITFGNRSVKGYTIMYDIFEAVKKYINIIYKEWLDGN